jgi:hypothetical protein
MCNYHGSQRRYDSLDIHPEHAELRRGKGYTLKFELQELKALAFYTIMIKSIARSEPSSYVNKN